MNYSKWYGLSDRSGYVAREGCDQWQVEPDRVEFTVATCPDTWFLIIRNPVGALNGYVTRDLSIDVAEVDVEEAIVGRLEPHGGVTYVEPTMKATTEGDLLKPCHTFLGIPPPDWKEIITIGFDCSHYHDLCPGLAYTSESGTYKNFEFVIKELARLYEQIESEFGK